MQQDHPWSVKGVPLEMRALAKLKAQQAGITMGAWLADCIRQASTSAKGARRSVEPEYEIEKLADKDDLNNLAKLVLNLAERVATLERLEKDTVEFAASFQDQLSDVRTKVNLALQQAPQQMRAFNGTVLARQE